MQFRGKCSRLILGTLANIFANFFLTNIVSGLFLYMLSNFGTSMSHSLQAVGSGSQRVKISSYRRFYSPRRTFYSSWTAGPKLIFLTDIESSEFADHVWVIYCNCSLLITATKRQLHLPQFLWSWGKCSNAERIGNGVSAVMLKDRTRNYTYFKMNWEL